MKDRMGKTTSIQHLISGLKHKIKEKNRSVRITLLKVLLPVKFCEIEANDRSQMMLDLFCKKQFNSVIKSARFTESYR